MRSAALLLLLAVTMPAADAQHNPLPIIDMHMHARTAPHYGPDPGPLCAPVEKMPTWDPIRPLGDTPADPALVCRNPVHPAATDADVLEQTLQVMRRNNIIGMLGGSPKLVAKWVAAAPGRFIPGLDYRYLQAITKRHHGM